MFKATFTYSNGGCVFSIHANYDSSTGKLTGGAWGSGNNYTCSGIWYMDR